MHGSEPDAELLVQIGRGEEAALRELYDRHAGWLVVRLQRRTSSADLVAEAVHDTFLAVWRHPAAFRGDGEVGAWLWGIAIRQLVNRLRRSPAPVPVPRQVVDAATPAVRSAEDELLVAVEHGALGDALRTLSPELRQALQVTVVDGLSTREAALLLGIPHGTVKSRVRLAKAHLHRQLVPLEGK